MENYVEKVGNNYLNFHRALVLDNNDPKFFGRVKVYIPDIMAPINTQPPSNSNMPANSIPPNSSPPPISPNAPGLWALPANTGFSGSNSQMPTEGGQFSGSSLIPVVGQWIWIFFENGDLNRPYYIGGLNIKDTPITYENTQGSQPYNKWILFRSPSGKKVSISDDPTDTQVKITGSMKNPTAISDTSDHTTFSILETNGTRQVVMQDPNGNYFRMQQDANKIEIVSNSNTILNTGQTQVAINHDNDQVMMKNSTGTVNMQGPNITTQTQGAITTQTQGTVQTQATGPITASNGGGTVHLDPNSGVNMLSSQSVKINSVGNSSFNSSNLSFNGGGLNALGTLSSDISTAASSGITNVIDSVSNISSSIMSSISNINTSDFSNIGNIVKSSISNMTNFASSGLSGLGSDISSIATSMTSSIGSAISSLDNNSFISSLESGASSIGSSLESFGSGVITSISGESDNLYNNVKNYLSTSTIDSSTQSSILNSISTTTGNMNNNVSSLMSDTNLSATNVATNTINAIKSDIVIPQFTPVPPPTENVLSPILTEI